MITSSKRAKVDPKKVFSLAVLIALPPTLFPNIHGTAARTGSHWRSHLVQITSEKQKTAKLAIGSILISISFDDDEENESASLAPTFYIDADPTPYKNFT